MTETVHDRIRKQLKHMGKSAQRASLDAGLSRDYLRTLFNRPETSPKGENLVRLAKVLETSPEWLLTGQGQEHVAPPAFSEAAPAPEATFPAPSSRELPVYGLAAGSITGAHTMTNDPVEYVPAPQALARVRDAYALIVTGSSMEPRYYAGDYLWIHPHKPIRPGDHVVIQEARDGGTVVSIKRFEKQNQFKITVTQYNPLATIEFSRAEVVAMHRVLTPNETLGV